MPVIGRREFELIMKMDDQTRKERESLNRGLGDIERTSKRASAEASRSIVDIAKQSKQSMEGIKAVMELGGWLAMANMVGTAFMNITEEARKNSQAFKEAGASLDVVGKKIGTGLVKAMEPLAEGFKQVMRYGTAVFENFPEVAMATFTFVKAIITKTLSWNGLSAIFTALARGIFSVFSTSFQYIPKIFMEIIGLLFSPVAALGQYIIDVIKNALSGKRIEDPFTFLGRQIGNQLDRVGALASTFGAAIAEQVQNAGKVASEIGAVYSKETADYTAKIAAITKDSMKRFDKESLAAMKNGEAAPVLAAEVAPIPITDNGPQLPDGFEQDLAPMAVAIRKFSDATVQAQVNLSNLQHMAGDFGSAWGGVLENLKSKFQDWGTFAGRVADTIAQGIGDALISVGKTLAQGKGDWSDLGKVAVNMLSQMLKMIAAQLAGLGVVHLLTLDFVGAGLAAAGAAAALLAAGAADAWAGSMGSSGGGSSYPTSGESSSSGAGAGGSASYAAGTSITIEKIEIKADFIAGDAGLQDVAVMLRDKLLEAERAGR